MARDLLASTADDSLALRILDILRRRRLLAIGMFAAVLAAAVSFAIYLPDLYRGQALVLVERPVDEIDRAVRGVGARASSKAACTSSSRRS